MTKREKALKLTPHQLLELQKCGALSSVAQALGVSGRGTPTELLKRIRETQKRTQSI